MLFLLHKGSANAILSVYTRYKPAFLCCLASMNWSGLNYRRYLLSGLKVLVMAVVCILCLVSKYWLYLLQVFVAWCQYWLWLLSVFVVWCQCIGYGCCGYLLPGVRILAMAVICILCQSIGYNCCLALVLAMAVAGICCLVSEYWLCLLQVSIAWCQSIGYTCCMCLLPDVRVLAMLVACICCVVSEYWLWLLHVFAAWCQSIGYGCCGYLLPGVRVLVAWCQSTGYTCCRYLLPGVRVLAIRVASICCLVSEYWPWLCSMVLREECKLAPMHDVSM